MLVGSIGPSQGPNQSLFNFSVLGFPLPSISSNIFKFIFGFWGCIFAPLLNQFDLIDLYILCFFFPLISLLIFERCEAQPLKIQISTHCSRYLIQFLLGLFLDILINFYFLIENVLILT